MVREPAVANQFYPGDKDTLNAMLNEMLGQAPVTKIPGRILGIHVPHAGYPFSGPTAAYAYNVLRGQDIKTVVILGPTHHVPFTGFAVYGKGAWKTPLGRVDIDEALASEIMKQNPIIQNMPQVHSREHSIEVQVPFLQKVLGSFKIVPIMSCEPSFDDLKILGHALAVTCRDKPVLIVASSDLYHGPSSRECERTDSTTLRLIEKYDPKPFYDALVDGSASACGGFPITAMMLAMKELGADKDTILHRTDSYAVSGSGEGEWVVGYAATVFYKTDGSADQQIQNPKSKIQNPSDEGLLSLDEQRELLRIARTTLDTWILDKREPAPFTPKTERLKELRGAFVTLNEKGQLRGCIGYIEGIKPVYEAVKDMAMAASTEDYRFSPVQAKELKDIDIEISVLTPLVRSMNPLKDIVPGKHGIVVKQGQRQGVFLPQVQTETGWDVPTFLSHCCADKAGLPADAWKSKDCEVDLFQAQVFGEKQ